MRASVNLKENALPVSLRSRSVPFSILYKIDNEIYYLISKGIFRKVKHSNWETPIVPTLKNNSRFRICGGYTRAAHIDNIMAEIQKK